MILKGDPKYEKEDMPVAAVFTSDKRSLSLFLKPVEREMGVDGVPRRVPKTGCRIQFKNSVFDCKNSELFKLMTASKHFCHVNGFRPDETDPTGFWRAAGVVESRMVLTPVVAKTGPLPSNFSVKKVAEKHAEMFAPEEGQEAPDVKPLAKVG